MYCKNCGTKIDDDSKFCNFCGKNQYNSHATEENKEINVNLKFSPPKFGIKKPISNKIKSKKEKYDETYIKEHNASLFGIIMIIAQIVILSYGGFKTEKVFIVSSFIFLALRIILTIWVVNIAKRQNRDPFFWGIFAFFVTSFTLIIIGMKGKIKKEKTRTLDSETNPSLNKLNKPLDDGFIKLKESDTGYILIYSKSKWEELQAEKFDKFYEVLEDKTN